MSKILVLLSLISPAAFALESGLYWQMQDSQCFHAVQVMNQQEASNLISIQAIGSCDGQAMLFCVDHVCVGSDDKNREIILESIAEKTYIYSADREQTIFHKF